MPWINVVSRTCKVILYLLIIITTALFTYYATWKIASKGSAESTIVPISKEVDPSNKASETRWSQAEKTEEQDATERQTARKKIMREYCGTHSFDTNPPRTRANMGCILVEDHLKIIYCSIPKVGITTWKRILLELRGGKTRKHVHGFGLWRRLYQYTEEEIEVRLQTYFKFLFVREPLHRLLSAFKNKFIGSDQTVSRIARTKIVKSYRPQDYVARKTQVSFPEFIQYFSYNGTRDPHWREYEKLCHPCLINYDFIGHLETLEEDAPLLLKLAGIDDRVSFPPVHKSTGSDEVLQYYSQVPHEDIIRIGELYRNDFQMFGFNFLEEVQPILNGSFKLS